VNNLTPSDYVSNYRRRLKETAIQFVLTGDKKFATFTTGALLGAALWHRIELNPDQEMHSFLISALETESDGSSTLVHAIAGIRDPQVFRNTTCWGIFKLEKVLYVVGAAFVAYVNSLEIEGRNTMALRKEIAVILAELGNVDPAFMSLIPASRSGQSWPSVKRLHARQHKFPST
jgi:hypothetical protein